MNQSTIEPFTIVDNVGVWNRPMTRIEFLQVHFPYFPRHPRKYRRKWLRYRRQLLKAGLPVTSPREFPFAETGKK